ncbi:MAG: hypothetical protein IT463_03680 [Planctomycetes bacterium]|nr:hypothetical protein [Planctomycetota bacterium]
MKATINGAEHPADVRDGETIGQWLVRARTNLLGRKLILLGARADGAALDLGGAAMSRPMQSVDTLELETQPLRALALEVLQGLDAALPGAQTLAKDITASLQKGERTAALTALAELVELCNAVVGTSGNIANLLGLDLASTRIGDRPFEEAAREFAGGLQEVGEAMRAQDYVAVTDQVQYVLAPGLGRWSSVLVALRERAEALPA